LGRARDAYLRWRWQDHAARVSELAGWAALSAARVQPVAARGWLTVAHARFGDAQSDLSARQAPDHAARSERLQRLAGHVARRLEPVSRGSRGQPAATPGLVAADTSHLALIPPVPPAAPALSHPALLHWVVSTTGVASAPVP
jgi:hypothetical protein